MLKLEKETQPRNASYLPRQEPESTHRLFVLVSSTEVDVTMLTRRVWELAKTDAFHVQFIGLSSDTETELATRRALVTMSSAMNFGHVTSDVEVIIGKNWVDKLKARVNQGDIVVYWDTEPASSLRRPLGQLLHTNLSVPLYIIPSRPALQDARSAWGSQIAAWIGFVAILLGFLFLQIEIYQLATNWTTILALLSTAVEFWLIWAWHNWFK